MQMQRMHALLKFIFWQKIGETLIIYTDRAGHLRLF